MIFKQERPPKHINCRGGLTKKTKKMLPKHINCRGSTTIRQDTQGNRSISIAETSSHVTQKKYHRNFAKTRKSTQNTAGVSSGEDTNAEDIGTPHTKITETSLHTRFKMQIISMRIPTFHHKSPTEHRHHTNGEEWTATKQETLQP